MILIYNDIELKVMLTRHFSRKPYASEDGQDTMGEHWIIEVDCKYHPKATTSGEGDDGNLPAVTDVDIRNQLMAFGKVLTLKDIQDNEILVSPNDQGSADARGGPYPMYADVTKIDGDKSWTVRYGIQTYVHEGNAEDEDQKVILSHRWEMYADVDDTHTATRTINGTAVFNMQVIENDGTYPDQFRQDFFHPVPENFGRDHIHCRQMMDGVTVKYTVIDRERHANIKTIGQPVKFECTESSWQDMQSVAGARFQANLEHKIASLRQGAGAISGGNLPNPGQYAIDRAIAVLQAEARMLPQYYHHINVKAWGNRESSTDFMLSWAGTIAFSRATAVSGGASVAELMGRQMVMTRAYHQRFIEVDLILRMPPSQNVRHNLGAHERLFLTSPNDLGGIGLGDGSNPEPPNANASRGTYLEILVSQALKDQGTLPTAPSIPPAGDKSFRGG